MGWAELSGRLRIDCIRFVRGAAKRAHCATLLHPSRGSRPSLLHQLHRQRQAQDAAIDGDASQGIAFFLTRLSQIQLFSGTEEHICIARWQDSQGM